MSTAAVVVGGANMDVKACSARPLVAGTSNPGHTVLAPGGVGRNIAENLARLGTSVRLVSTVGTDVLGDQLLAATAAAGVDVTEVRRTAAHATGTYTVVLGPDGELAAAVSDMGAVDALGPDDLPPDLVGDADLVVLDGNLAPATVERALDLARAAGVRVVVDPVSVPKAERLAGLLTELHLLTPNRDELAALTRSDASPEEAAVALHARGIDLVWVRLGSEGSLVSGPDGATRLPAIAAEVVDVTGAGDAMLGAFCHAVLSGAAPTDAARYGHAAAALTIATTDTVRPDLTDALVRSLL